MDRGRAAAALLALAACIVCSNAAPTTSDQTALEVPEGPSSGCFYNFQHYGEGDRIMTNEPCLNCTCHNRMLMCYLRVCPFTKPIGQDCTIEKRADQCCPIVTCPDVPVDLLTSTSTSSPAEYGATGLGKLDKYGCSMNGKYFPEGSKVPPSPNKPCEHCYCIRNMTTCVMQECTLHVDGCTPIYHKDVCCPVRYSCDHPEDEIPLLDDMTTTVRPTPGFLLTTTTMLPVTQPSQNCVHDEQIVPDGALIKTEKACEHCYCMKGDIVCVVQECGTPMENEGKNCTSLPPRQGQCCPDTYICEGDELSTEVSTETQDLITIPPRRTGVEGSGYRNEPDEPYSEIPPFEIDAEGSGEEHLTTLHIDEHTFEKVTPQITDTSTILDISPESSTELDKKQNTALDITDLGDSEKFNDKITTESSASIDMIDEVTTPFSSVTNIKEEHKLTTNVFVASPEDMFTSETPLIHEEDVTTKVEKTTRADDILDEATLKEDNLVPDKEHQTPLENVFQITTQATEDIKTILPIKEESTTASSLDKSQSEDTHTHEVETITSTAYDLNSDAYTTTPKERLDVIDTTSINPIENEIHESVSPIYSPGRIPGEGDCLLNSITYENNSVVPSTNNCHTSCKCLSSIIKCDPIICSAPPEYMNDCQPIYDSPESCCPTYVCSTKETIPPESHNQMSGIDSTKPVLASECSSPDCVSLENNAQPITPDCLNNECSNRDKDSSQDTQQVSCKGNECTENHPDIHHETPTICLEENGCTKPVEVHTQEDCTDSNCKTVPVVECSGSDCVHESITVTESELSVSTIHEKPVNELTTVSDVTNKIETPHDTLNPESPDREPVANTNPTEEYITVPIKSSTDISEMVPSHTEAPELHTIATNNEVTELPDQYITPTNTIHTESDINITDFPIIEKEQSTLEPTSPADIIEHKVTEADYSNEIKHETLSENKYETISDDEIRKTTIALEQATTKFNEQPVTDNNQLVTTELYEIKSDEPITPMQEEVRPTYSPDIHEHDHKEPTTGIIDHSPELGVTSLKDIIDTEQGTTESVIKESVTNREDTVAEGIEGATTKPALDSVTVVENKLTEKSESETESYPVEALSTKEYENTSEYSAVSEHQLNTKIDEHYTESPSTSEIEMKDKVTDSITTVVTESDLKVTETIHTSSESDVYKPISESTYDLSTDKIEQIVTGSGKESTKLPEIYTELSPTEQAKLDEQKTDVTQKLSVTEKIEHPVTEGIKEPIEVSLGDHEETLQTTESTITDGKPIEELKPTEIQYTSVTPAVLLDEANENTIPEIISTEKNIGTDEYPVTEGFESEEKLHTNLPATILTTTKDLDKNDQDLYETDKKTTEPKITTVSEEHSSTASYSIPNNKIDTSISSLEVTTSMLDTEKELHISTEIIPTKIPEHIAQDSIELNTEKLQEELPHTQATDSFEQHDSYTTEEGYPKTTSQANEKDLFEIPNITTILPLYTEEIKTPLPEDELLYTHEDSLSSHKQDSQSDMITTQEDQQSVSLEIVTSSGVTMISNVETTTNIPSQNQEHESESLFTTVKDVQPNEPDVVTEIDTKKPSLELGTTVKYEEHDTTDSIINVHVGDDERPNIDTKPPSIDMELITEKTESSTKSEGTSIQEISTVNENLVGVNVPGEIFTENPVPTSVQGITDNKINDNTETYTIIPEKTDVTTARVIEIDTGTKTPEVYSTSIQESVPAVSTVEPDVSDFTKASVSEMDEKKTEEEHALSTTAKPSDLNTEITTAMESITLADVEQHAVTTADNENKVTSSPIDVNSPDILDHKLDTTTVPEIVVTEIQNSTPLEEMPTNKHDKETMPAFDSTTQRDIPKVTSIASEVESSTIIKDDSTAHEENNLDSSNVDEDSLHTKRPEQQKPEVNTEKDIEQSGEPVTDHDNQQNVIPLEVSTPTPILQESGEPVTDHDNQQNVIPLEVSSQTPIQQETTFTPITSENLSSPDSAMSLVTDKVETVHGEPIPESTPSILTSVPIVTTETLPVIDQGLINTEKSVINEPEVYPEIPNDPIESDIKTTSSGENIYSTELNKRPDYITELPEETTTRKILDEILGNENNEILLPSITEKEPQLNTGLPDSTIESQSVTKESMPSNDLYESTTNVLLEKEMEVEPVTKESSPGVGVTDQYETTKASLLEKEVESQPSTKEPLPSINQYEPTISVLIDKDSEKDQLVTNEPRYPTTQSSQELYETTINLLREKDTEKESEKETQQPISSNTLYEATTIVSDVVADKESEIPVTEQSGPTKDLYEITTTISLEKATEKEIENQLDTKEPINSSDVSETTDSVAIEKQTEKDILMESVPNKDVYETTTTVITEKPKETEIQSVTKESPSNDLYDTTTSRLLEKQTIKETEYQTITEESISTNNLYEPTTSHLLEKEIDSVTQIIGSSSASSLTTVGLGVETTTAKIPESANDVEKSTESVIQYSETTPYHIELQEHTHQSIDGTSSKMPIDEDSTTEQYVPEQPDRGDVPNKEDNVNILPTSHDEGEDLITLKEEKSTTPTYITPDRESTVHSEVITENDQTITQSSSEAPKEEEKYSVIPIETETPLSPTPEIEVHTEKHIPDELEPHQTEVPADGIAHTEEVTKATTHPISTKPSEESTIHSEDFDKPEEKPVETGTSTEVPKPELNEPPSDDLPAPDFPTSGAGGYGQEPDYGDSEDQAFGPGTCRYGGKVYVSAQQIPRDDPCDFCFCFRSDIICLQQSCPPPIHGCHEEPIQGFCCPRYECPVSMATTLNVTTTTTTTTTTLPPHFLPHAYKGAAQKKGCQIKGHTYKVGEVVRASSGPCLHCTCGGDGQMKCDPKACTPEPMLRQMIAAAVSAKRRR